MQKIKILLVDDHQVMRKGLRLVLEDKGDIEVIAEASTGEEGIELTEKLSPDVVIMDLSLPGMDGVYAIRRIKEIRPQQRVLALTMHEDAVFLEKVLSVGGNGFVLKRAADVELHSAIRAVHRGEIYVDTSLQSYLVTRALNPREPSKVKQSIKLTPREIEILRLVALGYSNTEIAENLTISTKTVENHKTNIKDKLEITSRSQLTRYAMEQGLI